ncbi:MFS transporter [Roseomonas sp. NAR14]|uniref:MFS transporter n=1 Tax=Roseomonas acroporae TaxID=2937791 RepID=A0A9X1Y7F6_9PROT|nr:MFS transporter [Roseomonas acroporae]MCK8783452.1 MFS transporter [Roseomonas acroporae]
MGLPTGTLTRFLLLYALLYGAFGTLSPFFSPLLARHGVSPEGIGLLLGLGTAVRLLAGPAAGQLSDRLSAHRLVLAACAAAAAAIALGYLPAQGLWPVLAVSLAHAAVLAPLTPIADALALAGASGAPGAPTAAGGMAAAGPAGTTRPGIGATRGATRGATGLDGNAARRARRRQGFDYGWVRGAGSAAFVLASIGTGHAVGAFGLDLTPWLGALLLLGTAGAALLVPRLADTAAHVAAPEDAGRSGGRVREDLRALLRLARFRRMLLVAALVQGSHALNDGFAALRWGEAGIAPGMVGLLWSEAVMGEVLVFLLLGPWLLRRLGPAGASALAAGAAVLRWAVMGATAAPLAVALVQPLHGLTFALLHLACMRLIAEVVPPRLAATAQAFYGTVAVGAANVVLNIASGPLYATLGGGAYWAMAALCLAALPLCRALRHPDRDAAPAGRPSEEPAKAA